MISKDFLLWVTHWLTRSIVIRVLRRGALRNRNGVIREFVNANNDEMHKEIESIARHWRCDLKQLKQGKQWIGSGRGMETQRRPELFAAENWRGTPAVLR